MLRTERHADRQLPALSTQYAELWYFDVVSGNFWLGKGKGAGIILYGGVVVPLSEERYKGTCIILYA